MTGEARNISFAVNRAFPGKDEIPEVFGGRVLNDTVILCDGSKSRNALEDKPAVATTKRVNKANGFRSFIKDRLNSARGVAAIYLSRYNALFANAYAAGHSAVDDIFELMTSQWGSYHTILQTQTENLPSI
ncbi:MAG: hypothetical protein LBH70_00210 [Spirochaetaceae bacterium]|nr:hypothetical protein [Spirochaetaceae bacterium]